MTFVCPTCNGKGFGTNPPSDTCRDCGGRGVVISPTRVCPHVGTKHAIGESCQYCVKGYIKDPIPFTGNPVRAIDVSDLKNTLMLVATGSRLDEVGLTDPFLVGLVSGMLAISFERTDQLGWDPGEVFRHLEGGRLLITDEGIWHQPDPLVDRGVLICRFAISAPAG